MLTIEGTYKDGKVELAEKPAQLTQSRVLVTLGYAGWGPGQLEDEVARNGWLSVGANADVVFTLPPAERLAAAMALLGLNYGNLSDVAGHA